MQDTENNNDLEHGVSGLPGGESESAGSGGAPEDKSRRFSVQESRAETVFGVFFACLGILVYFVIIPWQIKNVTTAEWYNSPRFFPHCIAALIFVLGICLAVNGIKLRKVPLEKQKEYSMSLVEVRLVLITFVLFAVYTLLLKWTPYIPATIIILAAMIWFYGQRKIIKIISASVAIPVIIYLAFTLLLKLRLP